MATIDPGGYRPLDVKLEGRPLMPWLLLGVLFFVIASAKD